MTGSFIDVNAPDTAWRGGSEDPIPVIFGRYTKTAFVYRLLTARPLDGHARTDATFWRAGTKARSVSGRVMPYNYWPGWKRGLLLTRVPPFLLTPWTGATVANDYWHLYRHLSALDQWWLHTYSPSVPWVALASYGGTKTVRYMQNYKHERNVLRPIRHAAWAVLRTRDGVYVDIPRGMVGGKDLTATGRVGLPPSWSGSEGDRDNLIRVCRERLGHDALDVRWNMEGARPWAELYTPPQPPAKVTWDMSQGHHDVLSPYLGQSAYGPVHWDMSQDSPHMGIAGGAGSGKSELVAWIVAQFMRGGAGIVVLDPKWTSHMWIGRVPEVLYCRAPQMLHDTILWLDMELRRRGEAAVRGEDPSPRIVVVLEERNSLQTVLRDHWQATRPPKSPLRSPALAALDRLASMGRSFQINVILAAQEVTKADIGSRNNFGAFALAGRLPAGAWRLVTGPGSRKPAMHTRPGRFGYVVGSEVTVFQAAFPDLARHEDRLIEFATGGEQIMDVRMMMQQQDTPSFPRWDAAASNEPTEEYVTLSDFVSMDGVSMTLAAIRLHAQRDGRAFPDQMGVGVKNAKLYRLDDLWEWYAQRTGDGDE